MKTGNLAIALVILALISGLSLGIAVNEVRTDVVEVEKLVEVEVPTVEYVSVERDFETYKTQAVDLCKNEFTDTIELDKYEELVLLDVSDEWNLVFDGNKTISIEELTFRRFDTLTNERTTWTKDCEVFLEDGEEAVVELN
jgi:hypothetical protein